MPLGDAHIEKAAGEKAGKVPEPCTIHHGRSDGTDPWVLLRHLLHGAAEYRRKVLLCRRDHAGIRIKASHAVEAVRVGLRRSIALPFLGFHMDHHRAVQLLGPLEGGTELLDIVTVHRPQVCKPHVLKHGTGQYQLLDSGFDPVVEPIEPPASRQALQHLPVSLFEAIVAGPGADIGEVA